MVPKSCLLTSSGTLINLGNTFLIFASQLLISKFNLQVYSRGQGVVVAVHTFNSSPKEAKADGSL